MDFNGCDFGKESIMSSSPQLALAVDEASNLQCLQVSQKRLQLLVDLTNHAVSSVDVGELLHKLLACIRCAIDYDAASIALLSPEHPCVFRECAQYPGTSGRVQ